MTFSSKAKTMIPKGVATLLREGTFRRREIEKEILSSFYRWGYQEVIPPIFEYLDIFSLGVGEERLDSAYKFVDRATGRIMVLRPDVTPQVARIAATLLKDQPRPLRLCYSANVFRHQEEHAGRERELFQIGGELIGPSDAEADAEMIALSIEILVRLGLRSFRITIGQMDFTRGMLNPFISSPASFRKILHYVSQKEASQLEKLLKEIDVDSKTRRRVLSLLDLLGGEALLKQAATLSDHPSCRKGLKRLREIYAILSASGYKDYLLIDLGEVRGFDYYTGTIFEIFADGIGSELGGGGRYNHLLEKYGAASASTGFALYIERIQSVLDRTRADKACQNWVDFVILHQTRTTQWAIALTSQLRDAGFRVIRKKRKHMDDIDSIRNDARKQKIKQIMILPNGNQQNRIQLIDPSSGAERIQNKENIIEWLQSNKAI